MMYIDDQIQDILKREDQLIEYLSSLYEDDDNTQTPVICI